MSTALPRRTWVAIDPESKIVPTFAVGYRSQYMANCFIEDRNYPLDERGSLGVYLGHENKQSEYGADTERIS